METKALLLCKLGVIPQARVLIANERIVAKITRSVMSAELKPVLRTYVRETPE